jgi:hypothetical protein
MQVVYNNLNKVGLKTVPCGTPESTDNLEDVIPFKRTCCCLFPKKSVIQFKCLSLIVNNQSDSELLQKDLTNVENWEDMADEVQPRKMLCHPCYQEENSP